jgi:hypothetical protein
MPDALDFLLGFLAGVVMAMLLNLSVPYRHFRERRKLEAENRMEVINLKNSLREGVYACSDHMRNLQRVAERVESYARKLDMEMEKEKYKC